MIAVIADDFTGAAEIGGVALRHGLKVVIETDVNGVHDVDIIIVATDTRSMSPRDAANEVKRIVTYLKRLNPRIIFKKLDSVLRGNIISELNAQLEVMNVNRSLVVAGNPDFKRLIIDGKYYINGVPLDKTSFSEDPDFPIVSSDVLKLASCEKCSVYSLKVDNILPNDGIIFGDINNNNEMNQWASKVDETLLPAGGSGFFNAILSRNKTRPDKVFNKFELSGNNALFVFGSAYPKSKEIINNLQNSGIKIEYLPLELYWNKDDSDIVLQNWIFKLVELLNAGNKIAIGTNLTGNFDENLPLRIKDIYASVIKEILKQTTIGDLVIEGGATTSEILQRLGIKKLYPFRELDTGVIQMRTDLYNGLRITTKPGSYLWPEYFFE